MDKPMVVTAGIIRKDGRILISRRTKACKFEPDKWEFPGGKIDFGEKPQDCLTREIKEEIGIDVKVDKLFFVNSHIYEKDSKPVHVVLITYFADWVSGEVKHIDCQDSALVDITDLQKYDFVAADKPIIKELLNYSKGIY